MAVIRRSSTGRFLDWGSSSSFLRPATLPRRAESPLIRGTIPVELVRPTVTATATARIQVIEQRVMTRDNLLAVVDKFHVFAGRRNWYGAVAVAPLSRDRSARPGPADGHKSRPIELDLKQARSRNLSNAMAFSVSFDVASPEMARAGRQRTDDLDPS